MEWECYYYSSAVKRLKFTRTLHTLVSRKNLKRSAACSNIIVISAGGIGDTVLFSLVFPRFEDLVQGSETITILLQKESAKVGFLFGKNVRIISVDFNKLAKDPSYRKALCQKLYRSNYRLVISADFLRHPKKDEVLIKACHAPQVIAMLPRAWPKYDAALLKNRALYTSLFESGPVLLDKILRWGLFADWLTKKNVPPPLITFPPVTRPPAVKCTRPTVIFIPFSAVKEKQSPASLFFAIADQIPKDYDIIISCASEEISENPSFRPLLNRANVFLDESNFENLLPILLAARLVISVDTAAMHLAVASGTLTLCLASAAYVGEIIPYAAEITPDNVTFIYTKIECQGCLGNCILSTERGMFPCVSRILQSEVLDKVQKLLGVNS